MARHKRMTDDYVFSVSFVQHHIVGGYGGDKLDRLMREMAEMQPREFTVYRNRVNGRLMHGHHQLEHVVCWDGPERCTKWNISQNDPELASKRVHVLEAHKVA